ncbi:Arylsulfatase [Planctomycetes bacterium CA13]|uniref:Arylsulfatase n=1 Tax=Novipirellula herctigrandis TaxID=2527986 RepID=A0A5C5YNQ2_9BACT|nr:Arylsulfatase [Planctomycetes bacterium CA13]
MVKLVLAIAIVGRLEEENFRRLALASAMPMPWKAPASPEARNFYLFLTCTQDLCEAMKLTLKLALFVTMTVVIAALGNSVFASDLPNIVVILADDLGYGDVGCYNPESRIPTPNLDHLATEGMRFTDAHSPCTVCTPTRYSLMTGQMAFRVPNGGRVFSGAGGPSLIAPGRMTLPAMLRQKGYLTACFGKWHIGLTFFDQDGKPIHQGDFKSVQRIDYSRRIDGGPLDCGFDQFFGTACCPTTDWLYAFIDGNRIPTPPVKQLDQSKLPKHPYANDNRRGMIAPDFDPEEVDMLFLQKSQQFLEQHATATPDQPFFLFHSTQAVHLPSFPANRFKGKTDSGPHGDFIFELDFIVGELMNTLEKLGFAENTLVIFTSDNGPEVPTVYHMRHDQGHDGARPWRGVKRDNWEGGHRVPMIVRWPGKVSAGTTSNQLTSLTDVMATVAEIVDEPLPDDAAEDSFSMLPVFLGMAGEDPIRPYLLQQGFGGKKYLAIRRGRWKYLAHKGSGGNNYETHKMLTEYHFADTAPNSPGQLFDMEIDPGETLNLSGSRPEIVEQLQAILEESLSSGRSAPSR